MLFVLVLAWTLYSTQVQLRSATDARLLADSARRAAVVEDFLSEQEKLATQLAGSHEIEDYLTNEALGMSPRYGLNANIGFIEQRFQKTIERMSLRGDAFLRHIGFVKRDGAAVVAVGDGSTSRNRRFPPKFPSRRASTRATGRSRSSRRCSSRTFWSARSRQPPT